MTNLLLFTGKGGVGKSTASAATALHWARQGLRTILVSSDPAHSTDDTIGQTIGDTPTLIEPNFWAKNLNAEAGAQRFVDEMNSGLETTVSKWFPGFDPELLSETAMFPGMDEYFALEEILHLLQSTDYDLVVFDTAPTGHTLKALTAPDHIKTFLLRILRMKAKLENMKTFMFKKGETSQLVTILEEICDKIDRLKDLLRNPEFVSINLVGIATEAGFQETYRTIKFLKQMKIPLSGLIVNYIIPDFGEDVWKDAQSNLAVGLLRREWENQQKYLQGYHQLARAQGCTVRGVTRLPYEPRGVGKDGHLADYAHLLWNSKMAQPNYRPTCLIEPKEDKTVVKLHLPNANKIKWDLKRNLPRYKYDNYSWGTGDGWFTVQVPAELVGVKPKRRTTGNIVTLTFPKGLEVIEEVIEEAA